MPLIDDETRGNVQPRTPYGPWIVTFVCFVVIWLACTLLITVVPQLYSPTVGPAPAPPPQQQFHQGLVAQAQATLANGNAKAASLLIDNIPADAALDVSDKHTYFRVAAQIKRNTGDNAAAAAFSERFLSMGAGIAKPECQSCHGGESAVSPRRITDLETSTLGSEYVAALRTAGKLKSTRRRLLRSLKKQPSDPLAHLLLYHVEKALGNSPAAVEHADALKAVVSSGIKHAAVDAMHRSR
jgi:hypothetical protein